ncbi:hypothetical protein [Thermocoleostomius sinensis]|uniref:Uncharacterized protein n=1 Tax=Thermocoleostomius sinensis A174 TaxID=2016057 RepID=A0A9E9C503_9CYAN|nr:hypothetical protein [Thermocoleostomius sinensis]WAL60601.1 hypothetical protein OXH18_00985 [Thermocoleostomius sinensis A174]
MKNFQDSSDEQFESGQDNKVPKDPVFQQQVQRLHRLTVYSRWMLVALLWLCVAPLCLWALRSEIALWLDYFTWTAVRYTILYNRIPALGLIFCVAVTVSVLLWQSRAILWGLPPEHRNYLEAQVLRIRRQGRSHPLWKWVCEP